MKLNLVRIAVLWAGVLAAATVCGAPPNDNFADATPITGFSNTLSGSLVDATSEAGEADADPSVWWVFHASTNGTVNIENGDHFDPFLQVYVGEVLTNLSLITSSHVQGVSRCTFSFDVYPGGTFYVRASDAFPLDFNFQFRLQPAPENDAFESRIVLDPAVQRVRGTSMGATREPGEPAPGIRSVWWSWTPTNSGPLILTTAGSTFDTTLAVYSGSILTNLVLVASNDTAYSWPGTNGPTSDPASRLRLDVVAGTTYQLAVAGGAGEVVVNFEQLAIEAITVLDRVVQSDRSVDFTADLLLSNLGAVATGPLRVRLVARPWYLSLDGVFFPCPGERPAFDAPDQSLGTFALPVPGALNPSNSASLRVGGTVPPPYETSSWGFGYAVVAVLEEQVDGFWIVRDPRMIVLGDWAVVGGYPGPGGGVLLIVPTQTTATGSGYLQVHIDPAAARLAGAGWRLRGETLYRTNPNSTALVTTNGPIVIEFASVPGWNPPANQTTQLPLELLTLANVSYTVIPPVMQARAAGIGLTGTSGTTYRIEYRNSLATGSWLPLRTNTLGAGFNLILPWPLPNGPAAFYRAVWLP